MSENIAINKPWYGASVLWSAEGAERLWWSQNSCAGAWVQNFQFYLGLAKLTRQIR
jgi:hypothetical protein